MLSDDVERYITLRRTLGAKLRRGARDMRSFACFAAERGDSHVRAVAATAWAGAASTSGARSRRLGAVIRLARFLRAEDPAHEIPATDIYAAPRSRPVPYIYSADELARILDAASLLRRQRPNPLRRQLYVMLFGLIAATGLRVSEALALQFDDVLPGGISTSAPHRAAARIGAAQRPPVSGRHGRGARLQRGPIYVSVRRAQCEHRP